MEIIQEACTILVNGEASDIPSDLSVDALLNHLDRDPDMPGVAVAVNDMVVRRSDWPTTTIQENDRVEIITASQGG